jgi:large subunit ribosomal protein L25
MKEVQLEVKVRKEKGKGYARRIRRQGIIPAVLYGEGESSLSLEVEEKKFHEALSTEAENVIISLKVEEGKKSKSKTVILKEAQHNPVSGNLLHADFQIISLKKELITRVPLVVKGESPGVKEGGILEHFLREVEIECLPSRIPANISIDISSFQIGDSLFVKDLRAPEGAKILDEPEKVILTIGAPTKVEEEVPPEEEKVEEGAAEPEVIGEKEREIRTQEKEGKKEEGKKKEAPARRGGEKKEAPARRGGEKEKK